MPSLGFLKDKQYYTLQGLPEKNLICAFSSRQAGNMSLLYGDTKGALDNRRRFLGAFGIDYRDLICASQIHASNIKYAKIKDKGRGALSYDDSISDTDALVTDQDRLPLAVFSADCLPVFLYAPKEKVCAMIHAGWRSTKANITAKTICFMRQVLKTGTHGLYVIFGPGIRKCCYEVGAEFRYFFRQGLLKKGGSYYLDLVEANKAQALDSGVSKSKVIDSGVCTCCQSRYFFSYRKEGKNCGRGMSVIMLK